MLRMNKNAAWCTIFLVVVFVALTPVRLPAQVAGATLSGTITDPSGGVIPAAQVSIKNVATDVSRVVASNSDGFYSAPNLLPGTYEVTVSATGFETEVRKGLTLIVGSTQVLNFTMRVGAVSEKVEVTTEAPTVQLATSEISAVVNATTVRELPLNGRSWTDLATLQAGVDAIHTQPDFSVGPDRGNRGFGQQLTISGARPQQNNYRLDGVSLNDYANGGPGSVLGGNLGVDAIQEFSVLTSNYSAEYGKTSGGVVNAVTRSGTNEFHGSVYEFLRNSVLDAANFFDNVPGATGKGPFKRNQFGVALGAPIVRDHTFFFFDYEGIRQSKGIPNLDFVPSLAARSGILCSIPQGPPNPCATTHLTPGPNTDANGVNLAAKKYFALYPLPQSGTLIGNGDIGTFTFSGQQVINENFFTTRVDHRFSQKDSIFGTFVSDRTPYRAPDAFNNVELGSLTSRQIAAVEESHSFSSALVNSLRFGYNRDAVDNNQSTKAFNPAAALTSLGAFPGRDASFVNVTGLTSLPGGLGGLPTYFYRWDSFQAYDDAFLNKGTHAMKFGFGFERMLLKAVALTDVNGIWIFGDLQSFLTNNPTKFQGGIVSSLSPRNFRQNIFGAYFQDDWRWKSNLTLNLGLRYEMATVPTEVNGKLVNLRHLGDPVAHLGDPLFNNPTLRNFEPRFGFAWDPFHNGRTAVRGGIGLFDVLPLPYEFILMETQAIPFFAYTAVTFSPGSGAFFSGLPSPLPANTLRSTFIDSNPKRNYVTQWNLNVQYQLTPNLAAMVAYVGSRGVHQPFRVDDADLIIPKKTSFGYLWPQVDALGNFFTSQCNQLNPMGADPPTCIAPNKINPNFGSVKGMFYEGLSYYNALELQMSKRMSRGFQVQGVYTWGKSIDTSSATLAGDAFGNSIPSLHYFDMKLTRGLSDFNVGRTFVLNSTWEAPSPKSFSGFAAWPLSGWQLGLIFTASDGVPFPATWGSGSDPANTLSSDDWNFPHLVGGSGCNSLTNPGNPNTYIKTQCFAVPTAPTTAFWKANCDPAPPFLAGPIAPPLSPLACFNLRGNAGRNILIGPGVTDLDFSVFKNNYIKRISERFNVQFRAEIFNILNHANFAPPGPGDVNTDIFDGTGSPNPIAGALVRTTTTSREIQFALKVMW